MKKSILKLLRSRDYTNFLIALELMEASKMPKEEKVRLIDKVWRRSDRHGCWTIGRVTNFPRVAIFLDYQRINRKTTTVYRGFDGSYTVIVAIKPNVLTIKQRNFEIIPF